MSLLNIIRRLSLRNKLSIREIARRTGLSRNTFTEYLNENPIKPQFKILERLSKLDPLAEDLGEWRKTEAGKLREQLRTLKRLYAI